MNHVWKLVKEDLAIWFPECKFSVRKDGIGWRVIILSAPYEPKYMFLPKPWDARYRGIAAYKWNFANVEDEPYEFLEALRSFGRLKKFSSYFLVFSVTKDYYQGEEKELNMNWKKHYAMALLGEE